MQKEEQKIKNKQAAGLMALQKRIQRDRDEQLHHRKLDSATLIQRNKNVLLDILKRHGIESKRTSEFLKYALGKRDKTPGLPINYKQVRMNQQSENSLDAGDTIYSSGGKSRLKTRMKSLDEETGVTVEQTITSSH